MAEESPKRPSEGQHKAREQMVNRRDESSDYAERRRGLDSMVGVPRPQPVAASVPSAAPSESGSSDQAGDSSPDAVGATNSGPPEDYDG
jgi:hypothetical protein